MDVSLNLRTCHHLLGPGMALALSFAMLGMTKAQEISQTYVPPSIFSGSLYVATVQELSKHHRALLVQEFTASEGTLVCIGPEAGAGAVSDAGSVAETPVTELIAFLREQSWQRVANHRAAELVGSTEQQQLEKVLEQLDGDSCVWVDERELASGDRQTRRWLGEQLRSCLQREVTVCLDRSSPHRELTSREHLCEPIAAELELLPQMQLIYSDAKVDPPAARDQLNIVVPEGAWVRIRGRELFNLSEASPLAFVFPERDAGTYESVQRLPPRAVCDLVAMRRSLLERTQVPFPADTPYDHRLKNGSLVIVGGGGTSLEIWHKFIELAGGENAKILVLPTAVPEPEAEPYEARVFERLGVRDVRVLPQIDRQAVSAPEFLENFQWASGVWLGGGRQWRFVDAYWGTPAWQAMIDVAARGGVIGGSSAGATIQGDLLVRGHPLGNQIMIADGYRRGLGLLPGVAIDQHFRQRNRFDDLAQVVQRFPAILGVGIDEDTALVVEAPTHCSVIGKGSVWLSRPTPDNESRHYTEHRSGSRFDLVTP